MNAYDDNLRYSRRLGFVPRWVVMPTIRRQSVAEHCFHVAQTALWLLYYLVPNCRGDSFRGELLMYALNHDNDEAISGDQPSPSKPVSSTVSYANTVRAIVKAADLMEAYAYISEESHLGNRYGMESVAQDLETRMMKHFQHLPWDPTKYKHDQKAMRGLIVEYLEQVTPRVHPVMEKQNDV